MATGVLGLVAARTQHQAVEQRRISTMAHVMQLELLTRPAGLATVLGAQQRVAANDRTEFSAHAWLACNWQLSRLGRRYSHMVGIWPRRTGQCAHSLVPSRTTLPIVGHTGPLFPVRPLLVGSPASFDDVLRDRHTLTQSQRPPTTNVQFADLRMAGQRVEGAV